MIEGIVKKIMLTGIEKYAKIYNEPVEYVQIQVTNNPSGYVNYEMCKGYKAVEAVSFLQIMDKKFDILGYESMASPFLKQSIQNVANEHHIFVDSVKCFIMAYNKDGKQNIGLSFYANNVNLKNVSLSKHLQSLGL